MIKEIKMPSAGQTTDEVVVCRWLVKKGDKVERGDVLLEVETDKATLSIESFAKGIVIDTLAAEGDTIDAGVVLALVGDESDLASHNAAGKASGVSAEAPAEAPAAPVAASGAAAAPTESAADDFVPILKDVMKAARQRSAEIRSAETKIADAKCAEAPRAMPNAKRLAAELGVDLADVRAANGGLVKRSDVLARSEEAKASAAAAAALASAPGEGEYDLFPMTAMRKKIGARMLKSVQSIPAFQLSLSIDMTEAMKFREDIQARLGVKISYNDLFAKALAVTAGEFPFLNARYENDEIRIYRHTNIGLAVALPAGLVVPVIKYVESMGMAEIAAASKANIEKARAGTLEPADMGCGSTTISNLGMQGIEHFTAIVNPPECSIFALGGIIERPRWIDGGWKPVPVMEVTASYDHRVIDGQYGAQILAYLKNMLERPALMLH